MEKHSSSTSDLCNFFFGWMMKENLRSRNIEKTQEEFSWIEVELGICESNW